MPLVGDEFWCGRNRRHFRVSRFIPSSGDLPRDQSGSAAEDGRETGCSGGNQRPGRMTASSATRERTSRGRGEGGTEPLSGVDICFKGVREKGQVGDFVVVW